MIVADRILGCMLVPLGRVWHAHCGCFGKALLSREGDSDRQAYAYDPC